MLIAFGHMFYDSTRYFYTLFWSLLLLLATTTVVVHHMLMLWYTTCCCTVVPFDSMDQRYSRATCWCLQQIHLLTMCGSSCSLWVSVPFHPMISISTKYRPLFLAKNQSGPTNINRWCSDDLATTIPFFLPKHCWWLTMYLSWNLTKYRNQPRNCPVLPMWSDLDWGIRTWNSSSSPVEYCPTRHGATATIPKVLMTC